VFIGTELPELGSANRVYINYTDGSEHISIWDETSNVYRVVAEKTQAISAEDVVAMFNKL